MGSLLRTNREATSFTDVVAAAAVGQDWATNALADEFLPRLVSFAAARGAIDPDGIAHVCLLAVLRRLDELQFEAKEQMWAYLCRTARSRIIDEFRATKPVELIDSDVTLNELGLGRSGQSLISFDDHIVERHYVDELLSPLTMDQRQILKMRFIEDLSIEETASRTGRSQDAVKGLQRRAINAIIAAAAAILVFLAFRLVDTDEENRRILNAPADTAVVEDVVPAPEQGAPTTVVIPEVEPGGQARPDAPGSEAEVGSEAEAGSDAEPGANLETGSDTEAGSDTEPGPSLEPRSDPEAGSDVELQSIGDGNDRFDVTLGSGRSTELDTSGLPVPASAHGTRVYCAVSHFSYGAPVNPVNAPGNAMATMFWGNTSAAATSTGPDLFNAGNSSCEGGINDRSAYWMPALFDSSGQVVLPEMVLVEYKSFGGPGFDRTTVQPVPLGLALLANSMRIEPAAGDGSHTSISISFPNCVAVDPSGTPVLSSPGGTTHLAKAAASTRSGCPTSHPYRIPTLTYRLEFAVPYDSAWTLSSGVDSQSPTGESASGFIAGMDLTSMTQLVRCTRELIDHCEFVGFNDGRRQGRSQLPERFTDPDGVVVYTDSVTLARDADRTPFGDLVKPRS